MTEHDGRRGTDLMRLGARLAAAALFLSLGSAAGAAPAITPEGLVDLYARLKSPDVDQERHLDVSGRTLEREDLALTFAEGVVHPVQRSDGKIMGLVFVGRGSLTFDPPDDHERGQLQRHLGAAPYQAEFGTAWIMCTDDTVDLLLGEDGAWSTGDGGAPVKAKTAFDQRFALYSDIRWDDWGPSLEMDVLQDLYGDGYRGGHFYAEFAVEPTEWVTYYRNPRGALYRGEEVALFSHTARGDAPQKMAVFASYPSADPAIDHDAVRPYDLAEVEIVATVPSAGGDRNLSHVDFEAKVKIASMYDGISGLMLSLQSRKGRCKGDERYGEFEVSSIRDFTGEPVPAIHDRNRLFVVLRQPMNQAEVEILTVSYGGELFEQVGAASGASAYFTPLQNMAWYPRCPWPDRHSITTTIHAPRLVWGIATGDLVEHSDDQQGRHATYRESGGVLEGMMAIGEYQLTEGEQDGVRVLVFTSMTNKQLAKDVLNQGKTMLTYFSQLWGPYPYSTLTLIDLQALPAGNWQSEAGEEVLYAQEAGWTCSPPGQLYAWEGFIASDTGCMSYLLPATAPAVDEMETRALEHYFVETPDATFLYMASMVARQWWGQFVGPATYRDRWITESAALLSGALFMNTYSGNKNAYRQRIKAWHKMAIRKGESGALITGDRLAEDFPQVVLGKGPAVMQMMVDTIRGDPFVNMMRSVMNRAPKEGVSNELFRTVAAEYMGPRAEPFWDVWVEGTTIPGLYYKTEVVEEDKRILLRGELVFEGPVPPNAVPIEIKVSKKDVTYKLVEPTGARTSFEYELEKAPKKVSVDPDQLLLLRFRKPLKE